MINHFPRNSIVWNIFKFLPLFTTCNQASGIQNMYTVCVVFLEVDFN